MNERYDETELFPRAGSESGLVLRLEVVRLTTGHRAVAWDVLMSDEAAGPLALAVGTVPPFTGSSSVGSAASRLVRAWWDVAHRPRTMGGPSPLPTNAELLGGWYEHLELRRKLSRDA